jgi:hypothetical protein
MFPPRWFLPYDAVFQIVLAMVALAVAAYALRGHQMIKERTLFALFLSFLLMSIALFVNAATLSTTYVTATTFARTAQPASAADMGFWIYYLLSIMALTILIYAYADRLRGTTAAAAGALFLGTAAGGSLLEAGPVLEMAIVILLALVVMAQVLHYLSKRNKFSLMVAVSFSLILLGHLLIMVSSYEDSLYVLARFFELAGFISILVVLYLLMRGKG